MNITKKQDFKQILLGFSWLNYCTVQIISWKPPYYDGELIFYSLDLYWGGCIGIGYHGGRGCQNQGGGSKAATDNFRDQRHDVTLYPSPFSSVKLHRNQIKWLFQFHLNILLQHLRSRLSLLD